MATLKIWGSTGSLPNISPHEQYLQKLSYVALEAQNKNLKTEKEVKDFINSLPLDIKNNYIGNTSCIELNIEGHHLIIDAGSGFLNFAYDILRRYAGSKDPLSIDILLSHFHWDHILGLSIAPILFNPRCELKFYSKFPLMHQMLSLPEYPDFYPINLDVSPSKKEFITIDKSEPFMLKPHIKITPKDLYHPYLGGASTFRIDFKEKKGKEKSIIFASDGEYPINMSDEEMVKYIDFYKEADLLIFESQYLFGEAIIDKKEWGHSSPIFGSHLAILSKVKKLLLFHHEPQLTDQELVKRLNFVKREAEIYSEKMKLSHCPEIELALERSEFLI
jgi:ribonuclease BN (tRNA processing enzyme)